VPCASSCHIAPSTPGSSVPARGWRGNGPGARCWRAARRDVTEGARRAPRPVSCRRRC